MSNKQLAVLESLQVPEQVQLSAAQVSWLRHADFGPHTRAQASDVNGTWELVVDASAL